MKAFLLAAGLGLRLRPVTNDIPKCLVPVCGEPLMAIWLRLLRRHGVKEVLVNTHHLSSKVLNFAEGWSGPPKVTVTYEDRLLGSAGTVLTNWDFVAGESDFLVCYADNLTDIDLTSLIGFHRAHSGLVTMAVFRSHTPERCGIAEMGDDGVVLRFEEKPAKPRSPWANAGVYVMRKALHSRLPRYVPSDIGYDLLPQCAGECYGWAWNGMLIDIGDPVSYAQAQERWAWRPSGNSEERTYSLNER